ALAIFIFAGEGGLGFFDLQPDRAANEFQRRIAHQGARQQMALGQDLKAVADAQHHAALVGMGLDRFHHRRLAGHGAAAQVIAIGKTARQHHQIHVRQFAVLVPHHGGSLAGHLLQRDLGVAVAVGSGKDDDGGFHPFNSISYFSITVLASSFSHIALSSVLAFSASLPDNSRSITLPWRTSPTEPKPSPFRAWPMALPCGSRTPFLRVMKTRAFNELLTVPGHYCTRTGPLF